MVDPVNLNVPGLPYFLFAMAFFAVVLVLMWVLSPLELLIRRHQRLADEFDGDRETDERDGDGDSGGDGVDDGGGIEGGDAGLARFPHGDGTTPTIDGLFGTVRQPSSNGSSSVESSPPAVYECRHCGTTLDAGAERCPRCETPSIVRYETG